MKNKYEEAIEILRKNNQEHIIKWIEKANEDKKEALINQVLNINFAELNTLLEGTKRNQILNVSEINAIKPETLAKEVQNSYIKKGEEIIKTGKFAVIIMAGGQGSRLGHNGPKGTFSINLLGKDKYLFELIIDKLKEAKDKYNVLIPCYIMTSKDNNDETVDFFDRMNYFSYPKEYIKFFKQGEYPLLDKDGKLIIGERGTIKEASNGNGSIFEAIEENGILQELKESRKEWVFVGSVDNILLNLVDTLLIGVAEESNNQIATKTVLKKNPEERVGVFCRCNNKVKVIEYSEITEEMAKKTNSDGELTFGESHIMCNLFNIKALEKLSKVKLPYHTAIKKATYQDEEGNIIMPNEPNCYKFEKFIFDAFAEFDDISILRGKRERDFAPVKDINGTDSPNTAKKLYEDYIKTLKNS